LSYFSVAPSLLTRQQPSRWRTHIATRSWRCDAKKFQAVMGFTDPPLWHAGVGYLFSYPSLSLTVMKLFHCCLRSYLHW
jgi:hypothetical protein